jgi:hypothetical protein
MVIYKTSSQEKLIYMDLFRETVYLSIFPQKYCSHKRERTYTEMQYRTRQQFTKDRKNLANVAYWNTWNMSTSELERLFINRLPVLICNLYAAGLFLIQIIFLPTENIYSERGFKKATKRKPLFSLCVDS